MGTQDFFNLDLQQARLFVGRKPDTDALGTVSSGPCGRDPRHFTGHRVALGVLGECQQDIDIVAQLVLARGGNKHATFLKQRNVGHVKCRFFLDVQLNNAGPGANGGG